jgi:hypothetical protein
MSVRREVSSMMLLPLASSAGTLGTIIVASRSEHTFGPGHVEAAGPLVAPLASAVEQELGGLS